MPRFAGSGVSDIVDLSRYSKLEILHALICVHLSVVLIYFIELNKERSVIHCLTLQI